MTEQKFHLYAYRWVVLAVFMFINLTIQILWISYAPITGPAAQVYGVGDLQIGLLSMLFMAAFIPLSIPVSWAIDTFGFRWPVTAGALLMGICGLLRGLAGTNYTLVLWSTVGIAIAQPFLLNAWTKVAARWCGLEERATVVGLITLSNLVGTAVGMALTPVLLESLSIPSIQIWYGVAAAVSALLFLLLGREKPSTPPGPPELEARSLMLDGLKHALTIRSFLFYLFVTFVGMVIFNGVSTWVEAIIRTRGFTPADAGTLGALMLIGGVLGAVILPALSDRFRKRVPFLLTAVLLSIPGLIGLTFATSMWLLVISVVSMGFFLVSALPIGMQYSAEITYPTPEGTSNGLIQLCGQASVVIVFVMDLLKSPDGSFTPSLLLAIVLLVIGAGLILRMKEPGRVSHG